MYIAKKIFEILGLDVWLPRSLAVSGPTAVTACSPHCEVDIIDSWTVLSETENGFVWVSTCM